MYCNANNRDLHSFPTRRSSDLERGRRKGNQVQAQEMRGTYRDAWEALCFNQGSENGLSAKIQPLSMPCHAPVRKISLHTIDYSGWHSVTVSNVAPAAKSFLSVDPERKLETRIIPKPPRKHRLRDITV